MSPTARPDRIETGGATKGSGGLRGSAECLRRPRAADGIPGQTAVRRIVLSECFAAACSSPPLARLHQSPTFASPPEMPPEARSTRTPAGRPVTLSPAKLTLGLRRREGYKAAAASVRRGLAASESCIMAGKVRSLAKCYDERPDPYRLLLVRHHTDMSERTKARELISAGAELAGGAVSVALGLLASGGAASVLLGVSGVAITRALTDAADKYMTKREQARVGSVSAMTLARMQRHLSHGDKPRVDIFTVRWRRNLTTCLR